MNRNELLAAAVGIREKLLSFAAGVDDISSFTAEDTAFGLFFRLASLRYMEMNGLLAEGMSLSYTGGGHRKFRETLISTLHFIEKLMPEITEGLPPVNEDFFPEDLHLPGSAAALLCSVPAEMWRDNVQLVGRLYQYYLAPVKDEILASKGRSKVTPEKLPAATQIFTPEWIVRFMTDNSLGQLWEDLGGKVPPSELYFGRKEVLTEENAVLSPAGVRFIDPCAGSGNVLVYAFEYFIKLYKQCGISEKEAVRLILRDNISGADIDRNTCRIAGFALMMKAAKYDRDIFSAGISPDIACIEPLPQKYMRSLTAPLRKLAVQFRNAAAAGSLLHISLPDGLPDEKDAPAECRMMLRAAKMLSRKYDVCVTNPPYLTSSAMCRELSDTVRQYYPEYSSDLFSAFVARCSELTKESGYTAFLTPYVWMFISSYEPLRHFILGKCTVRTLIHFEYAAFDEATVPVCSFVLKNRYTGENGTYLRLSGFRGGMEVQYRKTAEAAADATLPYRFSVPPLHFAYVPGIPLVYWCSPKLTKAFRNTPLGELHPPKQGLITGDNKRFLRFWAETDITRTALTYSPDKKWYAINKGGEFRRWYGNREYVADWENNGEAICSFTDENGSLRSRPQNLAYNFKPSVSWSLVTSGCFSARIYDENFMFNVAGMSIFPGEDDICFMLGLLNSKIAGVFTSMINPTMNMNAGDVARLPVVCDVDTKARITELSTKCTDISKEDWDAFETSWDFKKHPFL